MTQTLQHACKGSECETHGIRVSVTPRYVPNANEQRAGRYVFEYRVEIVNNGTERVRLRSRRWSIVDADGERHEVQGMGVVGHSPVLGPGERFEYASFTPLQTPWGTMEGSYVMQRDDGSTFDVAIGRFYLVGPHQ
jgi:ApaG protein